MKHSKITVLFICTNNSARSQIAEGLLKTMYGDRYDVYSAGLNVTNVNAYAVEVMKEIGIDLSKHYSKSIDEFKNQSFDFVVTVCDNAKETCPFFPGKKIIHKNFKDPASYNGNLEVILKAFRKTREEIKEWIQKYFI